MKMVSVAVITVDFSVKTNVLAFRDYSFTMIFNDRPFIKSGPRKTDNKILTFLKLPHSNTASTLLVEHFKNYYQIAAMK
jgi:hypothetical protein